MAALTEVKVPDIGEFKDVPIIEVMVKPGDRVKAEDSLITLESDKATMDVPAPAAGTVEEIKVKPGDKVSEGTVILLLDSGAAAQTASAPSPKTSVAAPPAPTSAATGVAEVRVPDIGEFKDVPVIEIMVKPGDTVKAEDALITLESDKATMDVPAPLAGTVKDIRVKVGDKVSEGTVIVTLTTGTATGDPVVAAVTDAAPTPPSSAAAAPAVRAQPSAPAGAIDEAAFALAYAGPGVRKLARELGVDLGKVKGSGNKDRILKEDVEAFAKSPAPSAKATPAAPPSGGVDGIDLLPWPKVDFAKFGPIESKPLSRIKKISGANLHRNWVMIPHVTNHDDADITDLQAFRVQLNKVWEKKNATRFDSVMLKTKTVSAIATSAGIKVDFEGVKAPAEPQVYDLVLVAVGRSPNGKVVEAEKAGVAVSDRGFIAVDKQMRTNVGHIFAIGDIVGQPMLAHKAVHEAHVAAEVAAGHKSSFDARQIPSVAYTDPEVAWAGSTEEQCKAQGVKYGKAMFPWAASGRAIANGRDEGFTKLLFDEATHRLIGGGIVGTYAGDLIGEVCLAVEMGCDPVDIGKTIHPHPTLGESIGMAAEVFEGVCTDLPPAKKK